MPPLPESIITILGAFVPLFSRPVWCHAQMLLVGATLLPGTAYGDGGTAGNGAVEFEQLWELGVHLITKLRKNMKNKLLPLFDKLLLRQRALIETVNNQLKNVSQIEHSRQRSPFNFFVNLIAGLVAYTFREEKKPSLNLQLPQSLPAVVL